MARSKKTEKAPLEAAGVIAPAEAKKAENKVEVKAEAATTEAPAKIEDKKPVVEKIEDKKPETKKIADKKPATKKIADKKANTKKIEDKKATEKSAAKKAEKATEKKSTTKKSATKKVAEEKPVEKKTATRKTAVKTNLNLEFEGRSANTDELVKIARDIWEFDLNRNPKDFKEVDFYVKLEEKAVYYVINKEVSGRFTI